ncbi:MAG: hypothetical protein M1540_08740 [Candidatus Bathyarchaeota archaeon]|nr:hypothetical protein [Candidatus Bathyarchaeota archaeon]
MAIAAPCPIPYILLFIMIFTILVICLFKIPSLRTYRKRNLVIYALFALLLSVPMYQAYDTTIGPAIVTYRLDTAEDHFSAGKTNTFNITCTNLGMRQTNFNLIVKAINASLIVTNQQNYLQTNNTTIEIPFNFNGLRDTQSQSVAFTIDQNVSAFVFSCLIDYQRGGPIVTGAIEGLHCEFNGTTNHYAINRIYGPYV